MNHIIKQDEAHNIAGGLFPRIVQVIQTAFQHFLDFKKQKASVVPNLQFEPRTAYGIVHDFIKAGIKNEFSEEPNVRLAEPNGIFVMIVEEKLVLRFKKMDKDFQTSNVSTGQTEDFNNQELYDLFPNRPTFAYVGYLPDLTCTMIENICVFCRAGKTIIWNISLKQNMYQLSLQAELDANQIEMKEARVTPKKAKNTHLKTGTDDEPGV